MSESKSLCMLPWMHRFTNEQAEFLYSSEKTDREFNESWRKACPELEQLLTTRV